MCLLSCPNLRVDIYRIDLATELDQRVDVSNGHASNTATPLTADVLRDIFREELAPIKRELCAIHRLAIQVRYFFPSALSIDERNNDEFFKTQSLEVRIASLTQVLLV